MAGCPIPIGVDDFEKMIQNGYYYVDKTRLIQELLDKKGEVNLFTRPRRFGKTLNMSMLRCFFEDCGSKEENQKRRDLFKDTLIMQADESCLAHMTAYPVISLSLKSAKQPDFETAYYCLQKEISREFIRHRHVLNDLITEEDKRRFEAIMNAQGSTRDDATALQFLSDCLFHVYGQKTIILIDEYDVPLENAYYNGFYDEMVTFLRSLFESALKTNPSLQFAVLTGCLRISRESIFTGLNNLNLISILSSQYDEYFGFAQPEVDELLTRYGMSDKADIVKQWYDGYLFGNANVYNPWSVINYIQETSSGGDGIPRPYWSNTSSNSIVKDLIEHANLEIRSELETLIAGGSIEKQIHEDITYDAIYGSEDNLWNFLLFTGYLKRSGSRVEQEIQYETMAIPNLEIRYIYKNTILTWFDQKLKKQDLTPFYRALDSGDTDTMEEILSSILSETISFYDSQEGYYRGFLAGLLRGNGKYIVTSNRESGDGRPDLILRTQVVRKGRAIILEIKVADRYQNMETKAKEALEQIHHQKYRKDLENIGFVDILEYGICFWKKEAIVRKYPD